MNDSSDAPRRERTEAVVALAARRLDVPVRARFETFARECLRQLDDDDLGERAPEDLCGALLSHWQWGATRSAGRPRVRIINPTVADQGWASRHTVIQIVNDDMPFLVDSTTAEINRQGLTLHLIVHPIFAVERDAGGELQALAPRREAPTQARESWMHIEIDRLLEPQQRTDLVAGIERVLADVRAAVEDWPAMVARLQEAIRELSEAPTTLPPDLVAESRAFLQWLADDNLTLLGYRQHRLVSEQGEDMLQLVPSTGLGVLRETDAERASASFSALPANSRALARSPVPPIIVAKANTRSTVHRPGYTDYIGIKRYDAQGQVVGEHRLLGLFTSTAYTARVSETPLLRGKVETIAQRAGLPPGGHLAKALTHILETYPRDELFQISDDELYETALGILALGDRQRLRLFLRRDPFERFVSCLVYVSRDAYATDLRMRLQDILMQAFAGTSAEFHVQLGDTVLARIHFTIRTTPGQVPVVERKALESRLAAAARRWGDQLHDALIEAEGEGQGVDLYKRWSAAFPPDYRERVSPRAAVPDLRRVAALTPAKPLALALYRPLSAAQGRLGFKVYRLGGPIVLSDSLPMLEHMGVRVLGEQNYRISADGATISLHDFELQAKVADDFELDKVARSFEDCFARVFDGSIENDDFNRLVLHAGLAPDEVVILRAYAKYLKQIGFALTQGTIEITLAAHPDIARMLVRLFRLRFDPGAHDEQGEMAQGNAIAKALDRVSNLSEDRVLRQLLALVQATTRTNFWRTGIGHTGADGSRRPYLSLKFDSAKVPGLPAPAPLFEIFVYSPRFEGIHLRGGKVARGGLRWSERPEDFRTEVLGLVKAQMVKNTVIVPVGSKGGFVLKKAPPASDREAWLREGVACYQDYLRGLLDLTDNLAGTTIVPPPQVVRHDADDPYLVVAADKGTATFSDFANAVSKEYGHWLGDAFASGGSVGYDHKAMGITARGAWESVKRFFREQGVDIQRSEFTVVGIGDMSGDVFGNGMLLSPHIRLLAAFDHRHIFIDPTPDVPASHAERQRLFKLPRSSWADYESQLISAGGGVWSRAEKSIPLSPQARQVLGIADEQLSPTALVGAILRAPVDLLYNGGIGTYVKASSESNADVGDRANDMLRVNGRDLRCKVVGEGGNLGLTQRGRIEAAMTGVRINTDAIDNSAGVDTSDHEVNIKILLGLAVADGELTIKQRDTLLAQMTDDVAALVLRDNYFQTQALSVMARLGVQLLDAEGRFIRFLERAGRLHRGIEHLPSDDEMAERKARGAALTNPERAVLLAYGKMWLFEEILASDLPEDPWIGSALHRYFPARLSEKFGAYIDRHPLKREIIATHVLNRMVNRVGSTFVHRLSEMTGAPAAQVVRAYLATREVMGHVPLWQQVEALDNMVPDAVQAELLITEGRLTGRGTTWFLRSRRLADPVEQTVHRFTPAMLALRARLMTQAAQSADSQRWISAGVPAELAQRVASAEGLVAALDIAEIADSVQREVDDVSQVHLAIAQLLGLPRLRQQIDTLPADSHWQTLAKAALADDLAGLQRAISLQALAAADVAAADVVAAWHAANGDSVDRAQRLLAELGDAVAADLAMLSVALRELRNLV
ncbi:MAG: NAD-glutamate dehydrogenase [Rubrivivax sp.]|nr:NAD-glutamate dehydrogenase [Rubrivivax sp.]